MKWSELPQEYRDLEKGFDKECCSFEDDTDIVSCKFSWISTPQGYDFWYYCKIAKTIAELPKIPKNN